MLEEMITEAKLEMETDTASEYLFKLNIVKYLLNYPTMLGLSKVVLPRLISSNFPRLS